MDIISELNGKRILIWGYGREGKATEHFLQRCVKPASVDIFEGKKEEIDEDDYDFIIKSPGIVMNEENPKYTSETELFLQQFRDDRFFLRRADCIAKFILYFPLDGTGSIF